MYPSRKNLSNPWSQSARPIFVNFVWPVWNGWFVCLGIIIRYFCVRKLFQTLLVLDEHNIQSPKVSRWEEFRQLYCTYHNLSIDIVCWLAKRVCVFFFPSALKVLLKCQKTNPFDQWSHVVLLSWRLYLLRRFDRLISCTAYKYCQFIIFFNLTGPFWLMQTLEVHLG